MVDRWRNRNKSTECCPPCCEFVLCFWSFVSMAWFVGAAGPQGGRGTNFSSPVGSLDTGRPRAKSKTETQRSRCDCPYRFPFFCINLTHLYHTPGFSLAITDGEKCGRHAEFLSFKSIGHQTMAWSPLSLLPPLLSLLCPGSVRPTLQSAWIVTPVLHTMLSSRTSRWNYLVESPRQWVAS